MVDNKKPKILVVEDDAAIRDLIRMFLEKTGFQSFAADRAETGIDILNCQEIGIVLTDVQLPGMNGMELAGYIRENHSSDVIVMTGYCLDYSFEDALAHGASDLIMKPIRLEDLLLRINMVIKNRCERNEHNRKLEELKNLSIQDDLTGLFNSRQFYRHISQEVERSNRYFRSLSLILMDVDNFKSLNDNYGHLCGDEILAGMGTIIKSAIRRQDTAYRYAGDEFTIILPETEMKKAVAVAERVRQMVESEAHLFSSPCRLNVTVSIGVVEYLTDEEIKSFVHRADSAMYAAKRKGRNKISMAPVLTQPV